MPLVTARLEARARRFAAAAGSALALLAALAGAAPAAEKAIPVVVPLTGPIHGARVETPVCLLGQTAATDRINYLSPPGDRYFTHVRGADCGSCSASQAVAVSTAHLELWFQTQCTVDVIVSIVGADTVSGCLVPDTTKMVCPPHAVQVEPGGSGTYDLSAALSAGCQVSGDAFLCIEFTAFGPECLVNINERPWLVIAAPCDLCRSFNHYALGSGGWGGSDLCPSLAGRPAMYLEGDACVTATRPASWGRLKVLYR